MNNNLIRGVFDFEKFEDDGGKLEKPICQVCIINSLIRPIRLDLLYLIYYSSMSSGVKLPMEKWFSNLKLNLIKHLNQSTHLKLYKEVMAEQAKMFRIKDLVFNSMRHLSYFTLKAILAFGQFRSLLATSSACGIELGDLYHSTYFIVQFSGSC